MTASTRRVGPATAADLPGAAAIYDEQVRTGISTFDLEPPPVSYWQHHLASTEPGDHFLVADDDGRDRRLRLLLGVPATARATADPRDLGLPLGAARGQGLGRRMYDDLLERVRGDGIHVVLALVALPNPASIALHEACGFEHLGTMREVGRKFDRWLDTAWYQ